MQLLTAKGSYAVGIQSVFPSQTVPAHATMITGTLPADHGVTSDYPFNEKDALQSKQPYQSSKEIKTDTICELARRMNLITAAVGFPLTTDAAINFNLPDDSDEEKIVAPDRSLRDEILSALKMESSATIIGKGDKLFASPGDLFKAGAAAYIIEKHRPNLLLINFTSFNVTQ